MYLTRFKAQNFRCIEAAELTFSNGINYVVGENGAGKTSVLEAIYLLTTGQLQRGEARTLIRDGEESCVAYAEGNLETGADFRVGVSRSRDQAVLRMDGREVTRTELVSRIPILFLDPNIHALVEEGPALRRRFLDWGVFHVEHQFIDAWRSYRRLLRQRNASLSLGAAAMAAWDQPVAEQATRIDAMRSSYMQKLAPFVTAVAETVFPDLPVAADYSRGWAQDESLLQVLQRQRDTDVEQGYTRSGPHRADLRLALAGEVARKRLSRGEQKLLGLVLTLAQIRLHQSEGREAPLLLLDDLAAELSRDRRQQVLALLHDMQIQSIVTAIDREQEDAPISRMFHVEHGCFSS